MRKKRYTNGGRSGSWSDLICNVLRFASRSEMNVKCFDTLLALEILFLSQCFSWFRWLFKILIYLSAITYHPATSTWDEASGSISKSVIRVVFECTDLQQDPRPWLIEKWDFLHDDDDFDIEATYRRRFAILRILLENLDVMCDWWKRLSVVWRWLVSMIFVIFVCVYTVCVLGLCIDTVCVCVYRLCDGNETARREKLMRWWCRFCYKKVGSQVVVVGVVEEGRVCVGLVVVFVLLCGLYR